MYAFERGNIKLRLSMSETISYDIPKYVKMKYGIQPPYRISDVTVPIYHICAKSTHVIYEASYSNPPEWKTPGEVDPSKVDSWYSITRKEVPTYVFYCDSVSWDDTALWDADATESEIKECISNFDTSGDGSKDKPWRNLTYALFQIGCMLQQYRRSAEVGCCNMPYFEIKTTGIVDYCVCPRDVHAEIYALDYYDTCGEVFCDFYNRLIISDVHLEFKNRLLDKKIKPVGDYLHTYICGFAFLSNVIFDNCSVNFSYSNKVSKSWGVEYMYGFYTTFSSFYKCSFTCSMFNTDIFYIGRLHAISSFHRGGCNYEGTPSVIKDCMFNFSFINAYLPNCYSGLIGNVYGSDIIQNTKVNITMDKDSGPQYAPGISGIICVDCTITGYEFTEHASWATGSISGGKAAIRCSCDTTPSSYNTQGSYISGLFVYDCEADRVRGTYTYNSKATSYIDGSQVGINCKVDGHFARCSGRILYNCDVNSNMYKPGYHVNHVFTFDADYAYNCSVNVNMNVEWAAGCFFEFEEETKGCSLNVTGYVNHPYITGVCHPCDKTSRITGSISLSYGDALTPEDGCYICGDSCQECEKIVTHPDFID